PHVGEGMGAVFAALNRNKRAVGLDLDTEGGAEAFRRLAAEADVVVESFRPGALDRLGLGWDDLREVNDELILCSISGYGQTGPLRDRAGHDLDYVARAGLLGRTTDGGEAPEVPVLQVADVAGGLYGAIVVDPDPERVAEEPAAYVNDHPSQI
ncbi:MAG: CoA transferase, partial [Bradymonadaceae bacterium]